MSTTNRPAADAAIDETATVRHWVSRVTLLLLALLTVASVLNIHDMAEATHTAGGLAAWIVAIAVGGTLSVLAYVASITDGETRRMAAVFAVFAAVVSTALQVSLFLSRGAHPAVAVAFGVGVPFFEIALALTDSMLRRYTVAAPLSQSVAKPVAPVAPKPAAATAPKPKPVQPATPVAPVADAPDATPTPAADTPRTVALPVASGANISQLAQQLGVSRSTLYRRMKAGAPAMNGAAAD